MEINSLRFMALPKINRIKKTNEIKKVLKDGKKKKIGYLLFKFIENNLPISRFAIIISSRVSKKAVKRNKIKRQISEILRQYRKFFKKQIDGVFVCLPGIENQNFSEIKKTIEEILKEAKIL